MMGEIGGEVNSISMAAGTPYQGTIVVGMGQERGHCENSLKGIHNTCPHGPDSTRLSFCHGTLEEATNMTVF